ncbi:MAG TPA: CHAT domain-containing protein [Thermoanaerobaculia bacterium]|nr:CHAT domain-containing protein [Thermoanaerobaculia bacterium]
MTMNCPSEETLAAFIDGRLTGEARHRVVEHMAVCGECRTDVLTAQELASAAPVESNLTHGRFGKRPLIVLLAAAAAVAGIVLLGPLRSPFQSDIDKVVSAADILEKRPTDARLSGGFPYKERRVTRSGGTSQDFDTVPVFSLAGELQERADRAPDAATLHALGVAYLLLKDADRGVSSLEQAITLATGETDPLRAVHRSNDFDLLNDLAAAYVERGERLDSPEDRRRATETAERAWQLRRSAEIAWNRALALQNAGFNERASAAWDDFLRIDSSSEWATEARERRNRLSSVSAVRTPEELRVAIRDAARVHDSGKLNAAIRESTENARLLCEDELLAEAAQQLPFRGDAWRIADAVADVLEASRNDALLRETLASLATAPPERLQSAAQGFVEYAEGRRRMRQAEHVRAYELFRSAHTKLRKAHNPFFTRCAVYEATVRFYDGHGIHALQLIENAFQETPEVERYPLAAAQLYWIRGLVQHAQSDPGSALRAYQEARRLIERTAEPGSIAGIELVLADAFRDAGNTAEAWRHQLRAVAALDPSVPRDRRHTVLNGVVRASAREGYDYLAALVHRDVLDLARRGPNPSYLCDALVTGTQLALGTGDIPAARKGLAEAETVWSRLPDSGMKTRLRADLEAMRYGLTTAAGEPLDAALLTRSLELLAGIDHHTRLAELYLLRSRAQSRSGNPDAARADLAAGLAELERQRGELSDDDRRMQSTVAAGLVSDAIGLELALGDGEAAFDVAERSRARVLVERFSTAHATEIRPARWSELRSQIPPDAAVLVYALTPNRLITWVAQSSGLAVHEKTVDRDRLRRDVVRLRQLTGMAKDEEQFRSVASDLYEVLCGDPVRGLGAATLIVIPDSALYDVPFAALFDRRTGTYLIERHAVTVTPSATLIVRATQPRLDTPPQSALIVFVSRVLGREVLTAAQAERADMIGYLRNATVLAERDATAEAVSRLAGRSEIFHFGGHAFADSTRPKRSALLLTNGEALTAERIAAMELKNVRLAVLAACDSAAGTSNGDAPMALSTAFVTAGVPTVIAAVTEVDDAASAALFPLFYRFLFAGSSPSEALRAAQLQMIRNPRFAAPRNWAPFSVIGVPVHAGRRT